MAGKRLLWIVMAGLVWPLVDCSRPQPKGPSKDVLLAQLQQEAADLKKGGEDVNPSIGVKVTWTIEGVDMRERAGDKDFPWGGTIRFQIRSQSREPDGSVTSDAFLKRFDYRYSTALNRWIIDPQAPTTP
jgi:hypothetical protein